jgi:16S rRNA (cytosine(967)-C(5))-methyltransferase
MNYQFSFREHHLFNILSLYEKQKTPLDLLLRNYFKSHRAVGSKDRKSICDILYGMIRWQGLIDHFCEKPPRWDKRYDFFKKNDLTKHRKDETIPPHIRASFPKAFYQLLEESLGKEKAWEFCAVSNETAPTTIRVNSLKVTREALLTAWEGKFDVSPCLHSPLGILFHKKANFFAFPEFKEGLFEVQDEASQLIGNLVTPRPSDHVLDYCAGAGGKTLAFAPLMQGKGQIYLHDIRPFALQEAKKRLKRAGIQNAQLLLPDSLQKPHLLGSMDWVLVDAPCSGTGTLRRNPDMKWKFDPAMIERLALLQRDIFKEALRFLKHGGYIVYATCSVLPQENEEQVAYFQREFPVELIAPPLQTFPRQGEMDGFFGAVFRLIPSYGIDNQPETIAKLTVQ